MVLPLIPRRLIFGNPAALDARMSPDGNWITWVAPFEDVLNIWIAPRDDVEAARALTRTKARPINWHLWAEDNAHVLYLNDENGDENNHLFAVEVATGKVRDLTPIPETSVQINLISPDVPQELVVMINDRDARWHDAWGIHPGTGDRRLLWQNTQGIDSIGFDWRYHPRWARIQAEGGGSSFFSIENGQLNTWLDVSHADDITTYCTQFNRANSHLHMISSIGRDTNAVLRIDWGSKEETVVAQHPEADIGNYIVDSRAFEVTAACADPLRNDWFHLTPHVRADFALLQGKLAGFDMRVISQSADDNHWIVLGYKGNQAATFFHYQRDAGTVQEICCARPELKQYVLAPMQSIEGRSRDGLRLPCYLTLPADESGNRPRHPLPMILMVHGGPWGRDVYGYNRQHQWLANRGYAVISVNYRGSTGFGKSFVDASTREHGRKMFEDLLDMVEWAIGEGIADKARIAIYGASYGGYSAFLGATFAPEVFCCSVPVVGISNLQTLLENMPPYWASFAEFMYRSYGDPRDPEDRKLLAERSPIHRVDRVSKPMLIFHGLNDVRCKVSESETFMSAMQARNIPGIFIVYPDEGHGVDLPGNAIAEAAITEAFFARHMGGRCEPAGDDLGDSSYEVRAGQDIFHALIA
jgi:acetyl esterase/lipase